jgi:tRNA modification GTPase
MPSGFRGYTVRYGAFVDPTTGETIDDGLLTTFRAPRSYTGEDCVEISCHGGSANAARVLGLGVAAGARIAEPGEFTCRAFLNGRLDLAQAEAVGDLVRARTEASRRQARRQLEGALSRAVSTLREDLIGILAAIEVTIDFSDEVGDLDYTSLAERLRSAVSRSEALLATSERGRILRDGLHIAIVGRPNVGKSSLLNALLRADRAIVTPVPGTTRDVVEETAIVRGIPLVLTDTAGIRETRDVVERIGVERAEGAAANADVILFVFDATECLQSEDRQILARLSSAGGVRIIAVANKCDLAAHNDLVAATNAALEDAGLPDGCRRVSALTGEGLDELEDALHAVATGRQASCQAPSATEWESAVITSARQKASLGDAVGSLREAERTTTARLPADFIAVDVRGALEALGRITGETVTDDVIHRIFEDFCVGK